MKQIAKKGKKDRDEVEVLEQRIRQLKSENRSLYKQLKKLNRGFRKIREYEDEPKEEVKPKVEEKQCWDCKVGYLQRFEILNKYYRMCNNCSKRTKAKLIK